MVKREMIVEILRREIKRATGCTEPAGVVFAVSRAVEELGAAPDRIDVSVSANIYKNGANVYVPGTGMRGLEIAAAIGGVMGKSEMGLAILGSVDAPTIEKAKELVADNRVVVIPIDIAESLYIRAEVRAGTESATAVISRDYSNVSEVWRNGEVVSSSDPAEPYNIQSLIERRTLRELIAAVLEMDSRDLRFLIDAAELNHDAVQAGIASESATFGPALNRTAGRLPQPFAAMHTAQLFTAAAGEARMHGLKLTMASVADSGNHGITSFLGAYAMAKEQGSTDDAMARALAISCIVTIYIKARINRLTAFCGCAVTASTGVAAAGVYLLGGTFSDMENAMHSVIGTFAGMLCDGAKESCAFKISVAASSAIQFAYLALDNAHILAGMGMVGDTIEETIENLALLNDPGMVQADKLVLNLIGNRCGLI